jgi:hypothetical protein
LHPALDVAQQALFDRRVFGILEILPDSEREVLKGNEARISAYVDSAYFLVFNRTLQGIAEAAADTDVADISGGLRIDGAPARWHRQPPSSPDDGVVATCGWHAAVSLLRPRAAPLTPRCRCFPTTIVEIQ